MKETQTKTKSVNVKIKHTGVCSLCACFSLFFGYWKTIPSSCDEVDLLIHFVQMERGEWETQKERKEMRERERERERRKWYPGIRRYK